MRIFLALVIFITACSPAANNTTNNSKANASPANTPALAAPSHVTIESADGVQLAGSLFDSGKPASPALLLLHQWQSDRHSYDGYAKEMQGKGFVVLSIDGRGFGISTKKVDGTPVSAGRTDADVKGMLGDVDAAIAFLKKQNNVDPALIGIVGASYGSSLAIIYAADHPDIKAVALLSPGLNYFGNLPTEPAVKKYGDRDLFMAAAIGDKESADAVEHLKTIASKQESIILPSGTYHGTYLFDYIEKPETPLVIPEALAKFFVTKLVANKPAS